MLTPASGRRQSILIYPNLDTRREVDEPNNDIDLTVDGFIGRKVLKRTTPRFDAAEGPSAEPLAHDPNGKVLVSDTFATQ